MSWETTNVVCHGEASSYEYLLNRRFEYNISQMALHGHSVPASRNDISRGFVRYVGKVDQKSAQLFVGIEWDHEERGKHDGEVNGVRFFKTLTGKKSASFIKLETFLKFSTLGIDFMEAVHSKYKEKNFKDEEMFIYSSTRKSQISVELVGRKDLEEKLEKIENLGELGLQESTISKVENGVGQHFNNVTIIDLSANLIDSWVYVERVLDEFPNLHTLFLSSNRLSMENISKEKHYPNMKTLVMNDMLISWKVFVEEVLLLFPNVQEVHFRDNFVSNEDLDGCKIPSLEKLHALNLSGNNISSWESVWKAFSGLEMSRLLLNYNSIKSISHHTNGFASLKSLSVANNFIEDWDSINELNKFPCLEEIRLDNNLIQEKFGVANTRQFTIGRVKGLITVNGSEVRKKEREEAEKYYLKQCGREKQSKSSEDNTFDITISHPRYNELVNIYGDPCEAEKQSSQAAKVSHEFVVLYIKSVAASIASNAAPIEKKIPYGLTIHKLKQMCQRLFKLEVSKQRLFYIDVGHSLPEPLKDDFTDVDFYGVKDGGTIIMDEIDELEQQKKEEELKREKERTIKEQEEQVARELRWKQL